MSYKFDVLSKELINALKLTGGVVTPTAMLPYPVEETRKDNREHYSFGDVHPEELRNISL